VGSLRRAWQHAFAVDPPGPAAPAPGLQADAVDRFCREVARRHLATPALVALEMGRPLNFLASQTLQFFAPAVWAVARQQTHEHYLAFAEFLERRGSVDHLASRIEHFEQAFERGGEAAAEPGEGASTSEPDRSPPE